MGNKNIILAAVLIIGFMLFWDKFVVQKYAPPRASVETQQHNPLTQGAAPSKPISPSPKIESTRLEKSDGVEKFIALQNETSRVVFGTRGARIASWQIKEKDHWVELISNALVDHEGHLIDPGDDEKLAERLKKNHPLETYPELNFSVLSQTDKKLTLAADHPNGFRLTKIFELSGDPYFSTVKLIFSNRQQGISAIQTEFGWDEGLDKKLILKEPKESPPIEHEMRAVAWADKIFSWRKGFLFGRTINKTVTQNFSWIGVDNDHFIAAFLPHDFPIKTAHILHDKKTYPSVRFPLQFSLEPGEEKRIEATLLVSPKIIKNLKAIGNNLHEAVDFGFFGAIALFIFKFLTWLKDITGNYGWAIVITTISYQLLVYPLTKKTMAHSIKMKEVQPQIKEIQKKYKKDPKRLQIETMNLYKKHGMKFMGMEGCLPILIQIPFFFAVYSTLRVAFELRGAPWILWIHDLAAPDPLYILPVLMGIGTFLQQKVTNVSVDPAQAKMMMFMPIFLVFIFLKMPSGLVLYWCTQSFATILIQRFLYITHHKNPKPKPV